MRMTSRPHRLIVAMIALALVLASVGVAWAITSTTNNNPGDSFVENCANGQFTNTSLGVNRITGTCSPTTVPPTTVPPTTTRPPVNGIDLTPTALTMSPVAPALGQAVRFTAVIKNQGNQAVPAGAWLGIAFFVDGTGITWQGSTSGLAAGASVTMSSVGTWTATAGTHSVSVTADDQNQVAESNELNNVRSVSLTVGTGTTVPPTTVPPTVPPTTVPPTTVPPTVPPTTTPPASTSGLHVTNARIRDGAGNLFTPAGANVSTGANFTWNGDALGHSAEARAWGWNIVRLNICYECGFDTEAHNVALTKQLVNEYTAAGIVVIITSHDDMANAGLVRPLFVDFATTYRTNDRVWFDPNNEPNTGSTSVWANYMQSFINAIRATGNHSIISPDAMADAEDASWDPAYLVNYAGSISDPDGNLVFQIHNYGSYTDAAGYAAHLVQLRDAGFAVITGETGYKVAPYEDAGNKGGTVASLDSGFGWLVWHGTHGDGFYLHANGEPFYNMAAPLSDMGAKVWAKVH